MEIKELRNLYEPKVAATRQKVGSLWDAGKYYDAINILRNRSIDSGNFLIANYGISLNVLPEVMKDNWIVPASQIINDLDNQIEMDKEKYLDPNQSLEKEQTSHELKFDRGLMNKVNEMKMPLYHYYDHLFHMEPIDKQDALDLTTKVITRTSIIEFLSNLYSRNVGREKDMWQGKNDESKDTLKQNVNQLLLDIQAAQDKLGDFFQAGFHEAARQYHNYTFRTQVLEELYQAKENALKKYGKAGGIVDQIHKIQSQPDIIFDNTFGGMFAEGIDGEDWNKILDEVNDKVITALK